MRPVFRTEKAKLYCEQPGILNKGKMFEILHIFLSSVGRLVRSGLSAPEPVVDFSMDAKTGGLVPQGGPLILRRSVMTHDSFYSGPSTRKEAKTFYYCPLSGRNYLINNAVIALALFALFASDEV
jgi:hypothetical protein